ncbi:MAG: TIR domain-containing protein [Dehalococcoidia bacterium]
MTRRVFFSFHYKPDHWRASQVRNIGALEGNKPASDNDWEEVTNGGDTAIKKWIDGQMSGRSCAVVLIGANTSGRKWINYEITKAWNDGKGVLGIYIHNLKDSAGFQSSKGSNPFYNITHKPTGKRLSSIVMAYDPPFTTSTKVYGHIEDNIADWMEKAIEIRGQYD